MITGVEMPNRPIVARDLCAFRVGGFKAAKLRDYHTPQDVMALRDLGCDEFLVRLPASVTGDNNRQKGDSEWAAECVDTIEKFAPLGVTDYILDNEANLWWPKGDAPRWRWLTRGVIGIIREYTPANIRLGLMPLAWNPNTYRDVETSWIPEQRKIVDLHNFICTHSYWQNQDTFNHPPSGGNVTHWHDAFFPGVTLPYVVTEWGDTSHELGLPFGEVERRRLKLYPEWLRWISTKPYVAATYLFMLHGTERWAGHFPTDKVLRAIGSTIDAA